MLQHLTDCHLAQNYFSDAKRTNSFKMFVSDFIFALFI